MLSLAQTIKDLKNSIGTAYTNVTNNTFLNRIRNRITASIGADSTSGEIYNVIKDAAFSNLPPKIGYQDEKNVTITFTGLTAHIQSAPIFLGGYFSVLPVTDFQLKPNGTNYVYLSRDKLDYRKVNIENYDHLLGVQNNDMGINFSRILVSKITTDNKNVTSQEYFNIDYYGASKS